ncbi:MAG: undecaprenyl diphosphate synthase family protein, partial [Gammaproteobacteria bacterium]
LWDLAYTELCFTDTLWPDFGAGQITEALDFFGQRQRRFGRTGDQLEAIAD